MRSATKSILVGTALALAMSAGWAGLGGTPAKLGANVAATKSSPVSTGQAAYTDVQTELDSGVTLHEYVDSEGGVFAVSWSGPFLPDLKEILGANFASMTAHAERQRSAGRGPLHVKQSDVVIVSEGHMRAFHGRAWLPAKLPAGFDPRDIK